MKTLAAFVAAFAFALAFAQDAPQVPKLEARVTDLAGALSPEARAALESKLAAFEQSRGSQVAVLVVPTLGTDTIEEFAGRVADQWALGRKGVDDGVLFAVAMKERRMRIHTGRGVQGTLTDAASKRIVAEIVAPKFREGNFAGGIDTGVDAILRAIEGEELPAPARGSGGKKVDTLSSMGNVLVVGFVVALGVSLVLKGLFGRLLGSVLSAGVAGVFAWFLAGTLIVALGAAFFALVFSLFGGGSGRSARRGGWGGYIPGGGGGSWGRGGGGGGGGGFSGGGGGFDGGGASGSW